MIIHVYSIFSIFFYFRLAMLFLNNFRPVQEKICFLLPSRLKHMQDFRGCRHEHHQSRWEDCLGGCRTSQSKTDDIGIQTLVGDYAEKGGKSHFSQMVSGEYTHHRKSPKLGKCDSSHCLCFVWFCPLHQPTPMLVPLSLGWNGGCLRQPEPTSICS